MRRQGNEASPSIIHTSSIALLQERFRNLQRVKEMREGRELQRVQPTDHADRAGPVSALNIGQQAANSSEQPPKWFLHPDLVRPSRPLHGQPYHGHSANGAQATPPPPPPPSSWGDVPRMQNSGYRSDVDVDTSLHL